ncbi:hypothetical protein Leryth_026008 [Lithospermum erythrorhizon]|nr:hypothetical protein Leryth_026008 [Lithospermum erythrorhizon]
MSQDCIRLKARTTLLNLITVNSGSASIIHGLLSDGFRHGWLCHTPHGLWINGGGYTTGGRNGLGTKSGGDGTVTIGLGTKSGGDGTVTVGLGV